MNNWRRVVAGWICVSIRSRVVVVDNVESCHGNEGVNMRDESLFTRVVEIGEVGWMGGGDTSKDELLTRVTISEVVALLSIV